MVEHGHSYEDASGTDSARVSDCAGPALQACRAAPGATGEMLESGRTLAHEALSGEDGIGLVSPPRSSLYRKERVKIIKGVIRDE